MRTYTVFLRGRELKITSQQIADFSRMYISSPDLAERMTELFWLDLYVYDAEMGVSPHDVLWSIRHLEAATQTTMKAATQFKKLPLKGLWHQHYFSAQFLVRNVTLGFGKNGLERLINEVMDPAKSDVITKEMIGELAHRALHDPIEDRAGKNKMTGEWIIFLKRDSKNYYLCCNTHDAGDQNIYNRIVENCVRDLPELMIWLDEASKGHSLEE